MADATIPRRSKLSDRHRSLLDAAKRSLLKKYHHPSLGSVARSGGWDVTTVFSDDVPSDLRVIASTSSGIYLVDTTRRSVKQLTQGKSYGITALNDQWLFTWSDSRYPKKGHYTSYIFSADWRDDSFANLRLLASGIPNDLHQIDVFQGRLWVPHTGFDQVLTIACDKLLQRKVSRLWNFDIHPLDIKSPSHLNSVFFDAASQQVLVVAHNRSRQTGRSSEVLVCDLDMRIREVLDTGGHSVHNVCTIGGEMYFCDSGRRTLVRGTEVIFQADKLLRGLAMSEEHIVVGGSDVCFERNKRFSTDSSVYVLDRSGNLQGRIDLPATGDMYEVRLLDQQDYALSRSSSSAVIVQRASPRQHHLGRTSPQPEKSDARST